MIQIRSFFSVLLLGISLIMVSVPSFSADFEKGWKASKAGDYATALSIWTPLAEQGDWLAQFGLGSLYSYGRGVPQDYKTAVKWYIRSAEQGMADTQNNLGHMYVLGQGVLQDNIYAHMWFNIAASLSNEGSSKNRDIVAGLMTPADISIAQQLAREYVAKDYKGC